jgi:lipoprotein signal peptidase
MLDRNFRRWLIVLALLGVALDQGSKYLVFNWLYQHPAHYSASENQGNYVVIPGAFRLYTQYTRDPAEMPLHSWNSDQLPHVNRGALFGLMNDRKTSNYVFAGISILAAAAIILWSFRRKTSSDRLLCIALGLILGGTLGNLYDRLVFEGVRDFLYWNRWIDWPVFNIADCFLVVGACLLLFQAFLTNPAPEPKPEPIVETEPALHTAAMAPVN